MFHEHTIQVLNGHQYDRLTRLFFLLLIHPVDECTTDVGYVAKRMVLYLGYLK
jgi:hypothetical protein